VAAAFALIGGLVAAFGLPKVPNRRRPGPAVAEGPEAVAFEG